MYYLPCIIYLVLFTSQLFRSTVLQLFNFPSHLHAKERHSTVLPLSPLALPGVYSEGHSDGTNNNLAVELRDRRQQSLVLGNERAITKLQISVKN